METARDSAGFAGLRIAGVVASASALGGIVATIAALALDQLDRRASTELEEDVALRVEAGRTALASLEQARKDAAAAEEELAKLGKEAARIQALAIAARRELDPSSHAYLIDPASDRVLGTSNPALARGSTLSVALPIVARMLKSGEKTAEEGGFIWAVGPSIAARVAIPPVVKTSGALDRATNALVNLAAAPNPIAPPASSAWIFVLGSLFGAFIGALWANTRIGRPLAHTLNAARAFVHGKNDARADDRRGGRDARDVAREVNALIERAERLKAQGRAARDEDVRAVVLAIEALGRGDLETGAPAVGEALEPVAISLAGARRDLLERIGEIHRIALEVAISAADVAPGAKKIAAAALEELDTLRNLTNLATAANDEVKTAGESLASAVIALGEFAQAERRSVQELKTAVRTSGRRVAEIKRAIARVEGLIGTAEAIEGALDLLAASADPKLAEISPPSKARVTTAVGEARAALETIGRDLAILRDEMGETSTGLESVANLVPDSAPSLDGAVTGTLHDTTASLMRIVELTTGALRSLERSARAVSEGAIQIERGAKVTAELAPKLGAVVAQFSLGNAFEKEILDKIERWRRDVDAAAKTPDGLTDEGRAILRQVIESSEAARQRLARLVSATEAAIDVLRG